MNFGELETYSVGLGRHSEAHLVWKGIDTHLFNETTGTLACRADAHTTPSPARSSQCGSLTEA